MTEKLSEKYSPETAEIVVSRLIDEGYLNDRKYAVHTAEYMAEVKKFGAYRIKQELIAKGIDRELAGEVTAGLVTSDVETIKERIRKKYINNLDTPAGERKIQAAMARYGFKVSDVIKAVKVLKTEIEKEELTV
jgi:SOS response regulatory protein OraA/RecX